MEMKTYIEKAEKKAGKQLELAKKLGISDAYIRMVKTEEEASLTTFVYNLLTTSKKID